jgi:hypothetical protein
MIESGSATGLSPINDSKTTSVNLSRDYIQRLKHLLRNEQTPNVIQECGDHNIIVRSPRWPIRSILLVVRGNQDDRAAIEFAFCLARKCHASLVTLALVPDVPAFYRNFTNIQLGLPTLFELNTEPGCQLREILRRMACDDIKGDIQACQTTPDLQLKQVVGATNPDLIVISKEPYNRLWRFLFGEIIRPLLRWIDRPVLVA